MEDVRKWYLLSSSCGGGLACGEKGEEGGEGGGGVGEGQPMEDGGGGEKGGEERGGEV